MKLDDWAGPALGVLALTIFLGSNIRFLLQGRRYRRLDAKQQVNLQRADPDWEAYHGRQIPRGQLIAAVITAVLVLGYLICSNLGIFGR